MTEKRFQWVFIKDNELEFRDNGIVKRFDNYRLEEFLNELHEENEQLKQINRNLGDFRNFITEQNVSNEKQRKELQLQMLRLYNYFENYFEDTMSSNSFSKMWDNVKEDEKWD